MMKKISSLTLLLVIFLAGVLSGADILVPKMEMITRGYIDNGVFLLGTRGSFEIEIGGGYKLGGRLGLSLESDNLEDIKIASPVLFRSASVIARDIFKAPINFSLFTGIYDTLCTGDIFEEHYGTSPVGTAYRGYMYFPDGIHYDGIHQVAGTGAAVETSRAFSDVVNLKAYLYQDGYLNPGNFSADLRASFNFSTIKLESFIGASFPVSAAGYYRLGVLLYYDTETVGEFLTQIGIPRWDPLTGPLSMDLMYFLFEPRVRFGNFSIILTMFWHPRYYLQNETGETGSLDLNANFQVGRPEKSLFYGGMETGLTFHTVNPEEQFQAIVSPYLSIAASEVLWTFKINSTVFPLTVDNLFEAFIGVKAEF